MGQYEIEVFSGYGSLDVFDLILSPYQPNFTLSIISINKFKGSPIFKVIFSKINFLKIDFLNVMQKIRVLEKQCTQLTN